MIKSSLFKADADVGLLLDSAAGARAICILARQLILASVRISVKSSPVSRLTSYKIDVKLLLESSDSDSS